MRVLVGVLGGLAAALAFLVGAMSLTRIAGDYLGFPPGLEGTFTGSVDVAGIAGGVMWTAFTGQVRTIGKWMNIVCTVVSGVGVGLDHATHAGRALRDPSASIALPGTENVWPVAAFVAGVFMPALATWILHALAIIADTRQHRDGASSGDRQATHVVVTSTPPAPPAQDRQTASTGTTSTRPPPTTRTANRDRQPSRQVAAAALPAAPLVSARVGYPGPRPDWMTDDLLSAVLRSMEAAQRAEKPRDREYGSPRLLTEHKHLMPPGRMTDHKAKAILRYIRQHDLVRVSA